MRKITIRRCPVCQQIGGVADQLTAALQTEQDVDISIEDGNKGEFTVEADGRRIRTRNGDQLRSADELAGELRGALAHA